MFASQMRDQARLVVPAIVIAAFGLALGIAATTASYQPGVRFSTDGRDGGLVVAEVDHLSQAERDGIRPGLLAVSIDGWQLIQLPSYVVDEPSPGFIGSFDPDAPPTTHLEPARPQIDSAAARQIVGIVNRGFETASFIDPSALDTVAGDYSTLNVFYPGAFRFDQSRMSVLIGIGVLLAATWWLQTGRFGATVRDLAIPLAVATATPFLVLPMLATGAFWPTVVGWGLDIGAMLPLAAGLAERVRQPDERRIVHVGIGLFVVAAAAAVLGAGLGDGSDESRGTLRWILVGAIPLLPGLAAAGPIDLNRFRGRVAGGMPALGGLLGSTELAVAGATPLFALGSDHTPFVVPLLAWLTAIWLAARFTIRPLARVASRATLQRDLVVAAAEAERARLAADIHDDALQELTLLVRRLEASGDTEGAEIGRTVADRLRAICGDLRLPILDDLGVGPALDWLVLRIERLAGGEVRLERADDARHSPDVELAIFRVAQEALANAVKHGRPPIVVRYRSTPAGISLAVDDAGPGIADDAPETAEQAGRFGLLNMAQRAEQIGAILDVRRWPGGGTHVALEWRPR
ncbi:MAG TPA: ATP-binding protein [Candidatus Limnocylindrales bacterium]|nr:ATP-binding protein [Candidatus Limnocylindrales bacterium]